MARTLSLSLVCCALLCLLAGCSGGGVPNEVTTLTGHPATTESTTAPPPEAYAEVFSYTILEADHVELDFGVSEHDQLPMIRDFAIAPNGNLLLLQLSQDVCEYTPAGTLAGIYAYPFADEGLTAYMLTCDLSGHFYLLDGRSQLFIKADRNAISNVCALGVDTPIIDTGLITSMYPVDEDILRVDAVTTESGSIYEVDVSGKDAVFPGDPIEGRSLGATASYRVALMRDEEERITNSISLTIEDENGARSGVVTADYDDGESRSAGLVGLVLYGSAGEAGYIGKVFEWRSRVAGGETPADMSFVETFVLVDGSCHVRKVCGLGTDLAATIRSYGELAYIMSFTKGGLRVLPLVDYLGEWRSQHWFATTPG